jgi:hypothetical protein
VFPDIGVVDVQIDEEAELSSKRNSELGLEDERVLCPIGGLAEILAVTVFFLTFTKLCSEDFECMFTSTQDFGGVTEGSVWDCSINLDSHGLAAIQRSSQLHPQLFLSNS